MAASRSTRTTKSTKAKTKAAAGAASAETSSEPGDPGAEESDATKTASGGPLNAIPELMRRALSLGFSGFFMGEEAFRRALGDTLPKDWSDFAVAQSERTRQEFLERLSFEIGRALENVDLAAALTSLLEGRTLEVKAEIRLGERESGGTGSAFDVKVARGEKR